MQFKFQPRVVGARYSAPVNAHVWLLVTLGEQSLGGWAPKQSLDECDEVNRDIVAVVYGIDADTEDNVPPDVPDEQSNTTDM